MARAPDVESPPTGWTAAVEAVPEDPVDDGADPWSWLAVGDVGSVGVRTGELGTDGVLTVGVVRAGVVTVGVRSVGVVSVGVLTDGVVIGPVVIVGTVTDGTVTDGTVNDGAVTVGTDRVGTVSDGPLPSAIAAAGAAETASATHPASTGSLRRLIGLPACPARRHTIY